MIPMARKPSTTGTSTSPEPTTAQRLRRVSLAVSMRWTMSWSVPWVARVVKTEPRNAAQTVYSLDKTFLTWSQKVPATPPASSRTSPRSQKAGWFSDLPMAPAPPTWCQSQTNTKPAAPNISVTWIRSVQTTALMPPSVV